MKKILSIFALMLFALTVNFVQAQPNNYGIVTASNNGDNNELLVYDGNGKLLQTLSTKGKGGVAPNTIGGGIAKHRNLIAVINYNSQSVSLFTQQGGAFRLIQVIPTISKPVSLAFGQDHLYILGTHTIESHRMNGDNIVENYDGSARLLVGDGSAAQVGVLPNHLIISERSNMIELAELANGVVTNKIVPVQLPPAPRNDTPVGLTTRGDTAYVTIAHSDEVGLVKNGQLMKVLSSETQHAPCWVALMGPWLYCCNTPSQTISRYRVSDNDIELAELIAAKTQKAPSDIDAEGGIVAVLETANGTAQLTQFQVDNNGNLKLINSMPTANTANGIAVIKF